MYSNYIKYTTEDIKSMSRVPNGTMHRAVFTKDGNIIVKITQKRGCSWFDTGIGIVIDPVNSSLLSENENVILKWSMPD